ncbi:lipopolysaccharide/colanic/teichoic acid biosynthesis glycosyltransferase [Silicimonas algicola]|uniref:Lipopolysaccharide/colanic/teichoic acid biosynthesis glycosyltransferase n=2 Tax=Silicimonas algicola TaxID=1826607 RepID=A0A316GFX6_9RHOB|nr:lipopolysaccharide/colanic/teichoic acid biosynthesis glycosyltransferase [Silicimonas algicola]
MKSLRMNEAIKMTPADGQAGIRTDAHSVRFHQGALKRAFDLVFALMLLPIIAPVILALAIAVKRDGGPAFFGHRRVGRDGKLFRCWKIRTMVVDADRKLSDLLASDPQIAAKWQRDFKLDRDPRTTSFGQFLRETSLDELPQIWNVLTGEMSFVGPRPVVPDELKKYGAQVWAYHACVPGITGLWQVSGRNDISYDERVRLDALYLQNKSLMLDLKVLAMTVISVAGRTGK